MITPPRYKTARRLGAATYEKTLSPKFALRTERKSGGKREFSRPKTDYGMKMLEKQRVRFSYGISEKQFSGYVRNANESKTSNRSEMLYASLEVRLDNVVFRSGFAPSRQASRQMVSHGHIFVNGKRVTIPSFKVSVGDVLTVAARSAGKKLFEGLDKKLTETRNPAWLALNIEKKEVKVQGAPKADQPELYATLRSILEFYKR